MGTKSLTTLQTRLETIPEGSSAYTSVAFLLEVCSAMQAQGISNAELALRLGSTPAYVTRLFGKSSNLSVQTMAKLAQALGVTLLVGLGGSNS